MEPPLLYNDEKQGNLIYHEIFEKAMFGILKDKTNAQKGYWVHTDPRVCRQNNK